MPAGSLSTWFSWAALVSTFATLFFSGLALHYRSISSKEKDLEVASIRLEAAKSNAEAAKAHERIAELSTEADALKRDTAQANAQAEQTRLELAHFRAPRSLSDQQKAIIVEELKGKIPEINVVSQPEVESRAYRVQFAMLLRDAGIKVNTGSLSPLATAVLAKNYQVVIWSKEWMGSNGFPNPDDPLYRAISKAGLWGGSGGQASFIPDGSTESIVPEAPTIYIFQKPPW